MVFVISHGRISFVNKMWVFVCCLLANNFFSDRVLGDVLPIAYNFTLPSSLPNWPPGGGFASGVIDLGGLEVRQVSTFKRVWAGYPGGQDNQGASFFEPNPIPKGFSMLGSYAQPNARRFSGWVLVGKTDARDESGSILKAPTDYTLVMAQNKSGMEPGYFWLPIPPDGYRAVGHVVTNSPDKPPLDKIRCVRSDFTAESETEAWIWEADGINVYQLRPKTRGANAQPVSVGTFYIQTGQNSINMTLSCLKSKKTNYASRPNLSHVQALFQTYSPYIYLHPDEGFFPSSVNWYFSNGALLYKRGEEENRTGIQPNGTNLPQGGGNDGLYWMDLPQDETVAGSIKKGNLPSTETYLHVKSILGGTFTDIQVWIFYPFNGHSTARLGFFKRVSLGKIGEHVGDWEHVTLRISNFDGVLYKVYFAQHGKGQWVDASLIEFLKGNKFVGYSAFHSHATYYQPGLVLLGDKDCGIRDDAGKSDMVLDTGARFTVVAGDGLSATEAVVEPPWLNYNREWGPNRTYELGDEVSKVKKFLPGKLKSKFEGLVRKLPAEVFRQEGPTGPKTKNNWLGDEVE